MAILISRAHGQHRSIILINAITLKSAHYLLKTQLGISTTSYSHCDLFPIYGIGQGSDNSPGLWCAINSVLFDVYEKQACGASFYSPDKTINVKLYMIGFIDDTSGSTNDFLLPEPAPLTHYANLAMHDAQQGVTKLPRGGTTFYNYLVTRSRIQNAPTTSCTMNLPEKVIQYSKAGHLDQPF